MASSLMVLIIAAFVSQCSVSPKATPNSGFIPDNGAPQAAEMNHGWTELPQTPETKTFVRNKDSIQRGKELYQHHCLQCHGEKGKGDGKLAETLKIKPTNLQNMNPQIPNTYLSIRINEGKNSMPQWKNMLTPKQNWDLTQYILEFSKKSK